jgi:heme-degrading monooxygenase HmoA
MILRMWRAQSTVKEADKYIRHATTKVFPSLRAIEGHRGAYLLRNQVDECVEIVVLSLWESMDAVRRFAGAEPNRAVVEPDARAVLTSFDDFVTHFDVIRGPEMEPNSGSGKSKGRNSR